MISDGLALDSLMLILDLPGIEVVVTADFFYAKVISLKAA